MIDFYLATPRWFRLIIVLVLGGVALGVKSSQEWWWIVAIFAAIALLLVVPPKGTESPGDWTWWHR